jgi:hypothetical protein
MNRSLAIPIFAMLVTLACRPGCASANEPAAATPDPRTATTLSVEDARALVARQSTKPTASVPLAGAGQVLESLGVSSAQVERLLAEARALEPLGAADEVMLLEFLHRTTTADWLAIRGGFREFLDLPALARPDGDVLAALLGAENPGQVTLPGLRELDAAAAEGVARAAGGSLSLPHVERLSPEAAAALARSPVWLDLRGLTTLDPAVATALAAHRGKGLSLGGITALPDAIAEILATHAGHMSLRNLERLSDAAAAALARKPAGDLYLTGLRELRSAELAARLARQAEVGVSLVESLEPDVAAALVAGPEGGQPPRAVLVSGRAVSAPGVAEALASGAGQQLFVCGAFGLTATDARRLAASRGQRLCFRGLERLSADAARELAAFPRELRFPRLKDLDPEAAGALAAHKGPLDLSGLMGFPPDVIAALVSHQARIDFRGVTMLTPALARALAARKGDLVLPGLRTLDAEVAAALATHAGPALILAGVTTLPEDVAAALAEYRGEHLDLPSLVALDSVPLATRLASRGRCLLPKLATFPAPVAEALARRNADLVLPGVTDPGVEVAAALATHKIGVLKLQGIRHLDADVAAALASHQGKSLDLSGLVRLDALPLARRFASQERCVLQALTEITPEAAEVLATRPRDLVLPSLRTLTRDVAAALAGHAGPLSLPGLQEIDTEIAAVLATHRGGGLGLHGLREIDPLAASLLVRHEEPIDLAGLMLTERLDAPEVARLLVEKCRTITLPHLKRFDFPESRRVAEVLAATPGRLSIPNLVAVSPATLLALVRKEDVDIPAVEALELIAEPDGSATDDFVDPRPEDVLRRRRIGGIR